MSNHGLTATPNQAQPSSGLDPAWIVRITKDWSVLGPQNEMRWACPFALSEQAQETCTNGKLDRSLGTFLLMNLPLLLHRFPPGILSLASFQMYDPLGLYIWVSCTHSRTSAAISRLGGVGR